MFDTKQRALSMPLFAILSAAMLLTGCGKNTGNPSNNQHKIVIAVSIQSREAQFYQDMEAGMRSESDKYGYELIVVDANRDNTRQQGQVEDFIVERVSAIVLTPFDSQAIGSAILEANEAGVPVFTADIASSSPIGKVVSHIASDNVGGGERAGEMICQALPQGGEVAIIDQPSMTSVQDRTKGFKKAIAGCNVTLVADISGEGQRDKSNHVMEDLLQSHKNLKGVFAINDDSALGAANAIQAAGLSGKVVVIGFDATPEAQAAIKEGYIYGDAVQHPREIGKATVDAIHNYYAGLHVDSRVDVEVGTFTKKDAK
jgi:ribose transport system substrate-binding protein